MYKLLTYDGAYYTADNFLMYDGVYYTPGKINFRIAGIAGVTSPDHDTSRTNSSAE